MTIEIHQPEPEALIQQRMASGAFQSVEDVLLQALQTSPAPAPSGKLLVDAMQASPAKHVELEPARPILHLRDVPL